MSVFEYIYEIFNSVFSFGVYIYLSVIILNFLVRRVRKRLTDFHDDSSGLTLVDRFFSSHETQMSRKYQKQLSVLKIIAQQISEDREIMEETVLMGYYNFQDHAFQELNSIQSSSQRSLHKIMQEKYSTQSKLAEESLETLKAMKSDLSTMKNQMKALFSSQKMDSEQAESDSEITSILTEAKQDFTKLLSEKRSKEIEMLQTIIKFLQQSQRDIRKEVVLFNSVSASDETFDEKSFEWNREMTLEQIEKMKKNIISAGIFFNRLCSEMRNLQKIVMHCNQKCKYFTGKLDRLWNQNRRTDSSAWRRLEEYKIACTSLAEKIDTNLRLLTQQSEIFSRILADAKNISMMNKLSLNSLSLSISKKFEEFASDSTNAVENTWVNNIDVLNQKLENLVRINEKSKEKRDSLTRSLNNYENFHNLIKSMTRSYNTLLRYFITTLDRSRKFHHAPTLKQNEERVRNDPETYDNLRKMIEIKGNCAGDVKIWDEVQKEIDSKLQNANIENVVFLLKDIMQSIRKLFDEQEIVSGCIYETDVVQSGDWNEWADIPSESLLTDVSSEFLVHSSDESTGGLSEITLDG